MEGDSMRAAVLEAHGGVDQIHIRNWPRPRAAANHALVEVRACALNYLDIFVRRGMPDQPVDLPRIGGGDIAGIVKSVGEGVSDAWLGARVVLFPRLPRGGILGEHANGGLCEFISVDQSQLIRIPDSVDFNRAAALPIAYGTAHRMLVTHGELKPSERVLILGASGGVGTASVQIAKTKGAEVFACTSSEEKARKLKALGADHVVVPGSDPDFSKTVWELSGKGGINVAVNFTGGDTWIPTIRTMARHGRIITCGSTAGHECMIDVRYIWHRELRILGSRGYMPSDIKLILDEVANGRLNPAIDRAMPLENVREAMSLLEDRKLFGKVILNP